MSDVKAVSLFVIVIAVFGLFLESQGKLKPALQVITAPNDESRQTVRLGAFAIAFLVYLFILSFLSPKNSVLLTVVVVLGALLVNNRNMGTDDLIHTLTRSIETK